MCKKNKIAEKAKTPRVTIVEAMAFSESGHYRDKLYIWIHHLEEMGYEVDLVTLKKVSKSEFPFSELHLLSPRLSRLLEVLPSGIKQYVLFTAAYAKGIRISKKNKSPLISLTNRGGLPVYLATLIAGTPKDGYGFILMNCYLGGLIGQIQKFSFKKLCVKKCQIFANLDHNLKRLNIQEKENCHYLPDPIYSSGNLKAPEQKDRHRILVIGKDNDRRNAFSLVCQALLPQEIQEVHFHNSVTNEELLSEFKIRNKHVKVIRTDLYCSSEELYNIFAEADITVISYDPLFPAGSGNLVNALVAGSRVISTEIFHALYLQEKYENLITLFEYDNHSSFNTGLLGLLKTDKSSRKKFHEEGLELRKEVDSRIVVSKCISLIKSSIR